MKRFLYLLAAVLALSFVVPAQAGSGKGKAAHHAGKHHKHHKKHHK